MLRLLGPRSSNHLLVQLTRAVSNQTKTALSSSQPSNTRRFPRTPPRQVDLQKLFSDEPTASVSTPADPPARRPVVNPSATEARYEEDIADVDDYRGEEKRRLTARQTKNRKFSEPKTVQTNFDGLELIESKFDEKNAEQRRRLSNQQEAKTNQPRQPRRERSLTDQVRASETEDAGRTASTGMLTNTIKETKTIDELLNIFDSYIIPNEFAMGLQKLCQMASAENSDTVHLYQQGDKRRQRMETLLLNFLNKFNDHEVLRAISFVTKFYPEDNEFTDKFSLALNSRLRRISVHQIVNILEELKVSRHTAQWIHRTYNRLLSLAEGRYFEFDNIKDILSLTYKLSYNDRLINRLDERVLEIADSLTFDDWFKVLINKSMLKRRDRTVIRAACYHLLKLSDSSVFPLDKIKDSLLACAMLNVYDKPFLERLTRDAYEQVQELKDPFMIQSIITSMGTLRLRHCELLDALGRFLLEESKSLSTAKDKCIQTFIRTCAAVNYSPPTLPALIANHLNLEAPTSEENNPLAETKNRIDLVWSLAILDQADANHLNTVLNQNVFQLVQNEVSSSKIASALKLLAIYSHSLQKFPKKCLKPSFNVEQLAQLLTVKNANAQEQLAKTVTAFAAENKYAKFNVVTSNMIVIDCLLVVDKQGVPQDLATVMTSAESNTQTTFNKMRINENHTKIVLKCLDYQDKTLLTDSISGPIALQMKLLNSLGYKCVPIHYDEFIKIQVSQDRIKYLQGKIKEAVQPTTAERPKSSSSAARQKRNDDEW